MTECAREGKALATADGRQVPMKCHRTAVASIAMAVPLLVTGVMQWFNKIMLFGITREPKVGDVISLTLQFEKAGSVPVRVEVRAP